MRGATLSAKKHRALGYLMEVSTCTKCPTTYCFEAAFSNRNRVSPVAEGRQQLPGPSLMTSSSLAWVRAARRSCTAL
jgi:hypothetical protein